jgi:flagellar hook-length control protein FliK
MDTTSTPTPDRVFTVAAPATTPQSPANVQPAQVASQIAQQVDLYRLPGNKGVRIQLHPEDLGGVQVTLHYESGGNLELHINVEHAATGALVQASMPQLRDALASQGFHPDRLVMSVSAPSAAGQMDFSSNNNNDGSYRSDTSAMAAFTQNGQSNSQRNNDDGSDGPAFRGWNGATDPSPSTTINEATSTGVGSTSRIDYRV